MENAYDEIHPDYQAYINEKVYNQLQSNEAKRILLRKAQEMDNSTVAYNDIHPDYQEYINEEIYNRLQTNDTKRLLLLNAQAIDNSTTEYNEIHPDYRAHIDKEIYDQLKSNKTKRLLIRNAQKLGIERKYNTIVKYDDDNKEVKKFGEKAVMFSKSKDGLSLNEEVVIITPVKTFTNKDDTQPAIQQSEAKPHTPKKFGKGKTVVFS